MDRLQQLADLYRRLDEVLPAFTGNACGRCNECCTTRGATVHSVTRLELDYMAQSVGPERAAAFHRYARRDADSGETCPNYDAASSRCGVYTHRPFSCRVFGHYRTATHQLPEVCVFRGHERVYGRDAGTSLIPILEEFRALTAGDSASIETGDGWPAQVRTLCQSQDFPTALQVLHEAWQAEGESREILEPTAVVLELKGDHASALRLFEAILESSPEEAQLNHQAGYNAAVLGDFEKASRYLQRAVELDPGHAMALGFLAYVCTLDGRPDTAVDLLRQALAMDPDNAFFRLRLGVVLHSLGRPDQARIELTAASQRGETRAQALQMLESMH